MIAQHLEDAIDGTGIEGDDALQSYRPALQRLTLDAAALIEGSGDYTGPYLQGGLGSRENLVKWEQRLAVRTLGEVPMFIYQGIATQLVGPRDRPFIRVLTGAAPDNAAEHWRDRVRTRVVHRSFDRAFRKLRSSATEYTEEVDEGDEHNPREQRFIAMRPALDELDQWQETALDAVLGQGFEDRTDILDWMPVLENATHGEPIMLPNGSTMPVAEFVDRWHDRDPFARMLTEAEQRRNREAFAARFLIPTFNAGVREFLASTKEIADAADTNENRGPTSG